MFNFFAKKIYWSIVKFLNCRGFKSFGYRSYICKPDRIIGKKYIEIGGGVTILHHLRVEAVDLYGNDKFTPKIIIEDNVSIEENAHIIATGELRICKGTTISGNVFISDCYHDYKNIDVDSIQQMLLRKDTYIGENTFIGFGAVILPGVKLGKQCIVGANAVVLAGVYPDYSVLAGVPAKIVKQYNFDSMKWESAI